MPLFVYPSPLFFNNLREDICNDFIVFKLSPQSGHVRDAHKIFRATLQTLATTHEDMVHNDRIDSVIETDSSSVVENDPESAKKVDE